MILAAVPEVPRDLPVPGREFRVHLRRTEFLIPQNKGCSRASNPDQRQGQASSSSSVAAIPAPTASAPATAMALPRSPSSN